jgi:hypothetical protein
MARSKAYTNAAIIGALTTQSGLVFLAARTLGCSTQTIYARAKVSREVSDCITYQRGLLVDTAEAKLRQAVNDGSPWAVQFVLKTLGKDRGYVERHEYTGPSDAELDRAIEAELAKLAARRPAAPPGAAANGPPHA